MPESSRRFRLLPALLAGGGLAVLTGLAVAAPAFWDLFAWTTAATTRLESRAVTPIDRQMGVSFSARVDESLPLVVSPALQLARVQVGAVSMLDYVMENRGAEPITVTAVFSISPAEGLPYFSRLQCFCLSEQTLAPGERRELPVVFYIDPAIEAAEALRPVSGLALSYTFYPALKTLRPLAAAPAGAGAGRI